MFIFVHHLLMKQVNAISGFKLFNMLYSTVVLYIFQSDLGSL